MVGVYQYIWSARPKLIYYECYYKNIDELMDNIENKFQTEGDLRNGIGFEISDVTLSDYPYWVLNHSYAKEIRRKHFFTRFPDEDVLAPPTAESIPEENNKDKNDAGSDGKEEKAKKKDGATAYFDELVGGWVLQSGAAYIRYLTNDTFKYPPFGLNEWYSVTTNEVLDVRTSCSVTHEQTESRINVPTESPIKLAPTAFCPNLIIVGDGYDVLIV